MSARVRVLQAVPVVALAGVLAGCSSGGSTGGGPVNPTSEKQTTHSDNGNHAEAAPTTANGMTDVPSDYAGSWTGSGSDGQVSLKISGTTAELSSPHHCTGDINTSNSNGGAILMLTCDDGNTDRTMGSATLGSGGALTISWDIGITDTLHKAGG